MTDEILRDPWDEQPPELPDRHDPPADLSLEGLSQKVAELANELDRASRVLAKRISTAGDTRARYQLRHDAKLVQIRADGRRTAADERKALIHEDTEIEQLYLESELRQALVESCRAWVRGLEQQLSAAQSQLKAQIALLGVDDGARAAADASRTPLRKVA